MARARQAPLSPQRAVGAWRAAVCRHVTSCQPRNRICSLLLKAPLTCGLYWIHPFSPPFACSLFLHAFKEIISSAARRYFFLQACQIAGAQPLGEGGFLPLLGRLRNLFPQPSEPAYIPCSSMQLTTSFAACPCAQMCRKWCLSSVRFADAAASPKGAQLLAK
jgi:hypothetical protein